MATNADSQLLNSPCRAKNSLCSKDSGTNNNAPFSIPDMPRVSAEELKSISALEREQAYEELHGVFTSGRNENPPQSEQGSATAQTFEETPELISTSLVLLAVELDQVSARRKRAYLKALFLKPSLATDTKFQLMFLRADRFNVPQAAQRMCRFFEEKQFLFGEEKIVKTITLDDLSDEDISALFNGAGHVLPQKDRSGRLIFFADYLFLNFLDYRNINRTAWYLAMSMIENDEDVQKRGFVEVFFANGALEKKNRITEHLTKGLTGLLCLPIRFAGIHFCYDDAVLSPVVQLAQMVFGASNRLRFRSHFGSGQELRYELLTYGIVIEDELFDRDANFKATLDANFLSKRRGAESIREDTEGWDCAFDSSGTIPYPGDVLLGKGRLCQEYPGNIFMNRLVDEKFDEYKNSEKATKGSIALSIVDQIQDEGRRFLERDEDSGWRIVTDMVILRNKITQAFRVRRRPFKISANGGSSNSDNSAHETIPSSPTTKRFRIGSHDR